MQNNVDDVQSADSRQPAAAPGGASDGAGSGAIVRLAARAFERDRYLTALLAPARARDDLIAVAAFAGELARIPATISEPMIGAIRLQWWRDTIEAGVRAPTSRSGNPIADAMATAIVRHGLPLGVVIGFIDAQDASLGSDPPPDEPALTQHLAKTEGAQFEFALRILGGEAAVELWRPVVPAAAMAYGLTRLLVELPAHCAEGRTLLPMPLLAAAGLTPDSLYAGDEAANRLIAPLIARLATDARRHLAVASAELRPRKRSDARIAFAPLATVEPMLRAVLRPSGPPLSHAADILPIARLLRLTWTSATGRL